MMPHYDFTVDWFSVHIPAWRELIRKFVPDARRILEVGSYEGRSATWLIENAIQNGGEITCVDHWLGGTLLRGTADDDMPQVEARFDRNIAMARSAFPEVGVRKLKGYSLAELSRLIAGGECDSFDFVYIDGNHEAAAAMGDLLLGYHLCRPGGVVVCDDYLLEWGRAEPKSLAKMGIDAVVNCLYDKIQIVMRAPLYQLFLVKR